MSIKTKFVKKEESDTPKHFYHKAKKSMGQNFLKDKRVLADIRDASDVNVMDIVLEIGPGKGALTETLLFFAGKVIAIEKDRDLFEFLQEKFAKEISEKRLELLNQDVLEFDPNMLSFYKDLDYKIVANIPYNITGAIIEKFLTADYKPVSMTLLVQKEVAQRIVARNKKESILSLSVKLFGKPELIKKVKKESFSPAPKVDSAILHIELFEEKMNDDFILDFFKIVKSGFSHKRKKLSSNLISVLKKEQITKIFKDLEIKENERAEDLDIETWKKITNHLKI